MSGFETSLAALSALGDRRAWSLIVTVFGDMARGPEDAVSGPVLSRILEPVGVRPEAMRVALHRLRKDGWIISEKAGQTSNHRLSAFGLEQSEAASPRIYATEGPAAGRWRVLVPRPAPQPEFAARRDALAATGWVAAGGVFLTAGDGAGATAEDMVITGDLSALPGWAQAEIEAPALAAGYAALKAALERVDAALGPAPALAPVETAALRALIVHNWRRLTLKHPALPDAAYSAGWNGPACRRLTHDLLARLGRPRISGPDALD